VHPYLDVAMLNVPLQRCAEFGCIPMIVRVEDLVVHAELQDSAGQLGNNGNGASNTVSESMLARMLLA